MRPLLALLLLVSPAMADNCRNQNVQRVVVQDTGLVITPYAIPVGVPVAVGQYGGLYSYQGAAQAYAPQASPQTDDQKLFAEFQAWKATRTPIKPQQLPTAVYAACAKCHAGATPKGGFSVLGELSDKSRLRAVREIAAGRMPPEGAKVDAKMIGKVLDELTGEVGASSTSNPPPVPQVNLQPTTPAAEAVDAKVD